MMPKTQIHPLEGMDIPISDMQKSWDKDYPLQLGLTGPRNSCNLNCMICYTKNYDQEFAKEKYPLDQNKLKQLLREARTMGVKILNIPGYGEPFTFPWILPILREARKLGIKPVIFTNGTLITRKLAKELKDLEVSLMIKVFLRGNDKLQNRLTSKDWFSQKLWEAFKILTDLGFNTPNKNGKVLLATHTPISKATNPYLLKTISWTLKNQIFPFIEPTFPKGGAIEHQNIFGTPKEIVDIYTPEAIREIQAKFPGLSQNVFGLGEYCHYEVTSINIEQHTGKAVRCFTRRSENLGNYGRGDSLKTIWSKAKGYRRKVITKIDPRSPNYQPPECKNCADCPGRRAALEKLKIKQKK